MGMDWGGIAKRVLLDVVRDRTRARRTGYGSTRRTRTRVSSGVRNATPAELRGRHLVYAPQPDGAADPGEVVWAWVPYEEGDGRGKDRPILVIGRSGRELLGLMLSSNAEREGERDWLGLGAGAWDGEHRRSWIRLDRVLVVPEHGVRREGAVLGEDRFERVAEALRAEYGWH